MRKISILFAALLITCRGFSQVGDVDKAFQEARTLAFSSKYEEAKSLCRKILEKSPGYSDVRVLLGRVYFWNNQTDSALIQLQQTISRKPYEDAYVALADIQRWTDDAEASLKTSNEGLRHFPSSRELNVKKIKALEALQRNKEAYQLADSLLKLNKDPDLRQISEGLKRTLSKNNITLSYDYDYFDKQFQDPWHLVALSYGRRINKFGNITARVNIANRFDTTGKQFEIDAYPSLGRKMYAYVNGGYSKDFMFPEYRAGLSVYRNLPHAFEGELGFRLLHFSKTTILYTGSVGKYISNFWISLRPTYIASDNGNNFSQSYTLTIRYYTKSADDYLSLVLGYGLSPDDRTRETLIENSDLLSYKVRLGYQKLFSGNTILFASAGILRSDFYRGDKITGNNISVNIGYQRFF